MTIVYPTRHLIWNDPTKISLTLGRIQLPLSFKLVISKGAATFLGKAASLITPGQQIWAAPSGSQTRGNHLFFHGKILWIFHCSGWSAGGYIKTIQNHPSRVPAIPSPLAITISSYIFIYLHISSYIFHILPSSIKQSAIVTSSLILTICLSAPWVPLPGPAKRSESWQTWLKKYTKTLRFVSERAFWADFDHGPMPWYAMVCHVVRFRPGSLRLFLLFSRFTRA